MLAVIVASSYAVTNRSEIDQEDLKACCRVLSQLTDSAIQSNDKYLVNIYYNAYESIRKQYNISQDCDRYFEEIHATYGDDIGEVVLSMSAPPAEVPGFIHMETGTHERPIKLDLSPINMQKLLLYQALEEDVVNTSLLKANLEKLKTLDKNLERMKVGRISDTNLNSLPNRIISTKDFGRTVRARGRISN